VRPPTSSLWALALACQLVVSYPTAWLGWHFSARGDPAGSGQTRQRGRLAASRAPRSRAVAAAHRYPAHRAGLDRGADGLCRQ
jgi:hypothetical protein